MRAKNTKPIPTRFADEEDRFIRETSGKTNLSNSEIIRRSVRFMRKQKELTGDYGFLVSI